MISKYPLFSSMSHFLVYSFFMCIRYLICTLLFTLVCGCDSETQVVEDQEQKVAASRKIQEANGNPKSSQVNDIEVIDEDLVSRVKSSTEAFCGDCHAMPRPASSPLDEWEMEVDQGFDLYVDSKRTDLKVPARDDVVKFFEYQAPESLVFTGHADQEDRVEERFKKTDLRISEKYPPGITNIRWLDIGIHDSSALVFCDLGTGQIHAHWPNVDKKPTQRIATLLQPVHIETCDLDNDGLTDLVAADIGEFDASDSDLGRVVWLRRNADAPSFEKIVLLDDLSRIADVQVGDFDGDEDQDLIVAAFGWRNSGEIFLMINQGFNKNGKLVFESRKIDDRHGPINVTPIEINGDGHLDFIALIGQEHESIEAFINDGQGNFESNLIWGAPDPAYGSSGIELVDIDDDGDTDVIYSNGDSFDRGAKPFHSIQWLENSGEFPFIHHHITKMPGVLAGKIADFNGDGKIDIVAGSLIPDAPKGGDLDLKNSASLVLLTQIDDDDADEISFKRSRIELGVHQHLTVETGDFDSDGDLDFAAGYFRRDAREQTPDLSIWWNDR